jgi:peptide/nickel transport system substrate-binding protein
MLAPTGPKTSQWHQAGTDGTQDLQPYEQQLVDAIKSFTGTRDPAAKVEAMKAYQKTFTENVTAVGLTSYPGALIINKRFANIPAGAPIFMYNWAEDNIIRERVFVPTDKQLGAELHPQTLPGAPGSAGPVTVN